MLSVGRRLKTESPVKEVHTQWVGNKAIHLCSRPALPLKVDFQESRVTSEGSLFLVREVDQR
jgi:hypothetical protein